MAMGRGLGKGINMFWRIKKMERGISFKQSVKGSTKTETISVYMMRAC